MPGPAIQPTSVQRAQEALGSPCPWGILQGESAGQSQPYQVRASSALWGPAVPLSISCVFGSSLCLCGAGIWSSAQFPTKNDCLCSCGCLASLSSLTCSCNCSRDMRWYSSVCLGYSEAELHTGYFPCCHPWQNIAFSLDLIIFLWWFMFVFRDPF